MTQSTQDALSDNYDPLQDEHYMSPAMTQYFQKKLLKMKEDLIDTETRISLSLRDSPNRESDPVDRGAIEELHNNDFSYQEHEDRLRHEVELALDRIQKQNYGYCESTQGPIGVKRLQAVPYTRYSVEEERRLEERAASVEAQGSLLSPVDYFHKNREGS